MTNGRNLRVGYGGSRERGLSVLWEDEEESSKKPLTIFFTWPPRAVLLGKAYLW